APRSAPPRPLAPIPPPSTARAHPSPRPPATRACPPTHPAPPHDPPVILRPCSTTLASSVAGYISAPDRAGNGHCAVTNGRGGPCVRPFLLASFVIQNGCAGVTRRVSR